MKNQEIKTKTNSTMKNNAYLEIFGTVSVI